MTNTATGAVLDIYEPKVASRKSITRVQQFVHKTRITQRYKLLWSDAHTMLHMPAAADYEHVRFTDGSVTTNMSV